MCSESTGSSGPEWTLVGLSVMGSGSQFCQSSGWRGMWGGLRSMF